MYNSIMNSAADGKQEGKRMVDVHWQGRPDLGFLECDFDSNRRMVRWAHGQWRKVAYCHSEGHWVWQ